MMGMPTLRDQTGDGVTGIWGMHTHTEYLAPRPAAPYGPARAASPTHRRGGVCASGAAAGPVHTGGRGSACVKEHPEVVASRRTPHGAARPVFAHGGCSRIAARAAQRAPCGGHHHGGAGVAGGRRGGQVAARHIAQGCGDGGPRQAWGRTRVGDQPCHRRGPRG